jgi:uncharacterized protein RhaS with RHS repeats
MAPKNPHAVALGRQGGRANTAAQQRARAQNARQGGRPPVYRLVGHTLERRRGARWRALSPPYDAAAQAFLRRHPDLVPR